MTPQREEAGRYLRLARRDEAAFRALLDSATVDFSVACFHAQQAVEKALKAVMFLHGLELRRLTPYAVEFRYDDEPMPLVSPRTGDCVYITSAGLGR